MDLYEYQARDLFEKYGVDLVLTGHDHNYERSRPMIGDRQATADEKGITYLVVGGGGANLRAFAYGQPSWSALRNDTAHGFNGDAGTMEFTGERTPPERKAESKSETAPKTDEAPKDEAAAAARVSQGLHGHRGGAAGRGTAPGALPRGAPLP